MIKKFNIIGHRGYGPTHNRDALYPENTLKAFDFALRCGADGVELDVFLTRDGVPVVIHDQRLHDHVIPGQADQAAQKPVIEYSYAELQGFDLRQGEKIPTLLEVLRLVAQYPAQKIVNLDVKDFNAVEPILEAIDQAGPDLKSHPVVISTYNWDILRAFRKLDQNIHLVPAIKSAFLFGKENVEPGTYKPLTDTYQSGFEKPVIAIHQEINAFAFDCSIPDFTPGLIELSKSQGVGLQLSTGSARVDAAQTDYQTLNLLRQSTAAGVPFVICKVDEPDGVIERMAQR